MTGTESGNADDNWNARSTTLFIVGGTGYLRNGEMMIRKLIDWWRYGCWHEYEYDWNRVELVEVGVPNPKTVVVASVTVRQCRKCPEKWVHTGVPKEPRWERYTGMLVEKTKS